MSPRQLVENWAETEFEEKLSKKSIKHKKLTLLATGPQKIKFS